MLLLLLLLLLLPPPPPPPRACDHLAAAGHGNTVCSILTQPTDPQIITGSHDSQIKLWDLVAGKCYSTLTHHKKSVRGMALHPTKYMFASASSDNIKQWKCPEGTFVRDARHSLPTPKSCNRFDRCKTWRRGRRRS